jgi:hypothetical protein
VDPLIGGTDGVKLFASIALQHGGLSRIGPSRRPRTQRPIATAAQ